MVVKEEFLPKGWLPYLPDTNFVMCSYAVSIVAANFKVMRLTMYIAAVAPQAAQT